MSWTTERESLLKLFWLRGDSASQIAKQLGGVTRNAVIGKRIRMGLPDRVTPTRASKRKPPAKATPFPAKKPKSVPTMVAAPVRKPRAPERGPNSVRHSERTWFQCPMFCAGEEGASGFICGSPIDFPAQKFCKACSKFAYMPAPPVRVRRVA